MIDPNKGATETTLRRLKKASYEVYKVELVQAIGQLLNDFEMTWDDLAATLEKEHGWAKWTGAIVKKSIGSDSFDDILLNDIAAVFSTTPYVIFRPRDPWIPRR